MPTEETKYNSIVADKVAKVTKEPVTVQVQEKSITPTPPQSQPITSATVVKRQNLIVRLAKGMFGPDSIKRVVGYVGKEVIAPAFKDMVRNGLHTSIDMMIDRGNAPRSSSSWVNSSSKRHTPTVNHTSYNKAYSQSQHRTRSTQAPIEYDFKEYGITEYKDAKYVLDCLRREIDRDGQVPVSYYYYLLNMDTSYVDQTVGWIDLSSSSIKTTRSGYFIELPYPIDL
jgi:hypothetical protein